MGPKSWTQTNTNAKSRRLLTTFNTQAQTYPPKRGSSQVTFFDFPAEHWKHLPTTNVIESPFATVRLRERATRGAGSRTKGLLMAFKLLDMVQLRWRHLDGAQLLPLVRAGVKFADGVQVDPAKHVTQSTDNQPREAA